MSSPHFSVCREYTTNAPRGQRKRAAQKRRPRKRGASGLFFPLTVKRDGQRHDDREHDQIVEHGFAMRHDGRDAEEDAAHDRQHRHDVAVKSVQLLFPAHDVEEHRNIERVERDDRQLGRVEAKRAEPALGEVGAVEICQPDGAHEHAHDGGVRRHVRVLVDAEERLRPRLRP